VANVVIRLQRMINAAILFDEFNVICGFYNV